MDENQINNNYEPTYSEETAETSHSTQEEQQTSPHAKQRRDFRDKRSFRSEDGGKHRGFGFKKKRCRFCGKEKKEVDKELNYKNVEFLQKFVTDTGKILPGRLTGTCFLHQKKVQLQVKRARYMAFLPFTKVERVTR